MNFFSKYTKYEAKIKEAKKLIYDNKLNEAIELCEKQIQEFDEQKEKDEVNKILVELYMI